MVDLREILRSLGVKEDEIERAEEAVDNILLTALRDGVTSKDAAVYFHAQYDDTESEHLYRAITELYKAESRALRMRRMH